MASETKQTGWALKDAQELINAMAAKVAGFGYAVLLGGSVLTKGESKNDLDLFFIPSGEKSALPVDLLMWLASKFGPGKTIQTVPGQPRRPGQPAPPIQYHPVTGMPVTPTSALKHKMEFDLQGRKIEVFVV